MNYNIEEKALVDSWKELLYNDQSPDEKLIAAKSMENFMIADAENQVEFETVIFPILQRITKAINKEVELSEVKILKNNIPLRIIEFKNRYPGEFWYKRKIDIEVVFCNWFVDLYLQELKWDQDFKTLSI